MKFFHFEKSFDFKPAQNVTMHYSAGSTRKVTEAIADAATAAGVGAVDAKATVEVIVEDGPQTAPVIRAAEPYAAPPKPAASEKPAKAK